MEKHILSGWVRVSEDKFLPFDTQVVVRDSSFDEGNGHHSFHTMVWDMQGNLLLDRRDGYGWGANALKATPQIVRLWDVRFHFESPRTDKF
jgi:hypothetical protein